jgi:3-oxoacyl-[acyl-carrier protein] reductase
MDLGISGRKALVLGGTKGLGLACARALAEAGVVLTINGRDPESGKAAADELGAAFAQGDIADAGARTAFLESVSARHGPFDIVVTNAGGPPPGAFLQHDLDTWRRAIETNMLAAIEAARMFVPGMAERGFGRVVNVTSFAVREPYPNMALANGARAGLHGAMATLAREVAGQGVTINNLLPGLMDTGALRRVYAAQAEQQGITQDEAKARMAQSIPAGRLGTAEDFGPFCAFLCSRHAGYVTGQNITVDGGLVRSLL